MLVDLRYGVHRFPSPIIISASLGTIISFSGRDLAMRKAAGTRSGGPRQIMAPQVGLEPTTLRLTAECSAIELLRNKRPHIVAS